MRFAKSIILIITLLMLIPLAYSATATTLGIGKSPDIFEQPEEPYTIPYESGELSIFFDSWNESSEQYEFFDGCLEGYGSGGYNFHEVLDYSCMNSTFKEKLELNDKTILKNLHWFDDTGTYKKTGMAIFAQSGTKYYAYFWYAQFDETTDTHYRRFYYVPELEYITTDTWGMQIYQSQDKYGVVDEVYYFDDPTINKTGILKKLHAYDYEIATDDCNEHQGWSYYIGNASVAWYVSSATQVCGGSGSPISTSEHNLHSRYDTATAITPSIYLRLELNATVLAGNQGRIFYSGIRYRVDDPTDCPTCQSYTSVKANDEMMYLKYFNPIRQNKNDYTGEPAKVYVTYIDTSTGNGINGATCTGTKTYYKEYPYNEQANQFVTKTFTAYEDYLNDGQYYIYFMDDQLADDQPSEQKYTFTFSCSKVGYDSQSQSITIWLTERGGYQGSDRFRYVSMENVFDTVSAYDVEGNLLDISNLKKDQEVNQVLFRIYERDTGYIKNLVINPNQTVINFKEFGDIPFLEYDDPVYAVGVRLWSDDFYCSGLKSKYKITPMATYAGTDAGYCALSKIGTSNFGFDTTLNPTSFCLGTRTGGVRLIQELVPIGWLDKAWACIVGDTLGCSGYRLEERTVREPTISKCYGFSCSEETNVYMQIKICEQGSINECADATLLPTITFNYVQGDLELKYPQVINKEGNTQMFYGRLFSLYEDTPVVFGMDKINCTVNITGSDSSNIVLGQLQQGYLDALTVDFTPTGAQRNDTVYNYSLYCDAEQAGYQNLYQIGKAYVGDYILGQAKCAVIPNRFRPETYVTTYCELGASDGDKKLLDNFTIQYNVSLGNQSVIKNMTTIERQDYKVWDYSDVDYYRNQTSIGIQSLEDGDYKVWIYGEDGNGNYPSFEQYADITIDSNLIDVDSYIMAVWDNVHKRGWYQTGDNYSCSIKWIDPDKKLFRAQVEIGTVLDSEEYVFVSEAFKTRQEWIGSDLTIPLLKESTYKDVYDLAGFDPIKNTYTLTYNFYEALDSCDVRGTVKLYNASAFATTDIFLEDVCPELPLRERDNIKCTWTLTFGTNVSGISGNKSVVSPFRRLSTIDLWAFGGNVVDQSGIGALFGNLGSWITHNILFFIFIIFVVIIVAIVLLGGIGGENGGLSIAPAPSNNKVIGGSFE